MASTRKLHLCIFVKGHKSYDFSVLCLEIEITFVDLIYNFMSPLQCYFKETTLGLI